jgi:uncharacterized protein (UPF0548 family)
LAFSDRGRREPAVRFSRPSAGEVERFLDRHRTGRFTYEDVGATRGDPPPGYDVDHNRIELGRGDEAWGRAREAIRGWTMFRSPWLEIHPPRAPIEEGSAVVVVTRQFGLWWLNASRVVYTVDEPGPLRRFGFAYGTLPGHAESGEERFTVELHADGSVWYDLFAFSRPRHPLVRMAKPLARALQRKFAAASLRAMRAAVASGETLS